MALNFFGLTLMKEVLASLPAEMPRRAAFLGYPDLLISRQEAITLFGEELVNRLSVRSDSDKIIQWHSQQHKLSEIYETVSLFEQLGVQLDIMDIVQSRGFEIKVDLNEPMDPYLLGNYGLVYDGGTTEHCFNYGQAIRNVSQLVALGGWVLHSNPLNMFNHGFYNLNPTAYYDFYSENGFKIAALKLYCHDADSPKVADAPSVQRFNVDNNNWVNICLAQRVEYKPFRWPMQTKYKKLYGKGSE